MRHLGRTPSISVAPGDPGRLKPVPLVAWLGLVVASVAALVLVFPKGTLHDYIRREAAAGRATLVLEYLRVLIPTEPDNWELHLLLAERQAMELRWDEAARALALATRLAPPEPEAQVRLAALEAQVWRGRLKSAREAMDRGDAGVLQALVATQGRTLQQALAQAQTLAAWQAARQALRAALAEIESDLPELAAEWRAALSNVAPRLTGLRFAQASDAVEAARLALSEGDAGVAAELYSRALALCGQQAACLVHWRAAVANRLASGEPQAAWPWAREILGEPAAYGEPNLGWELARVAAAAGQPRAAATELKLFWPDDAALALWAPRATADDWALAWQLSAGGGDLVLAERVAAQALASGQPPLWGERLAQVREWTGRPQAALEAWLAQWHRAGSEQAFVHVQRLGSMLYDDQALLDAWRLRQQRRPLDDVVLRQLVALYERVGNPEQALALMDDRLVRARGADDAPVWQLEMAELLVRMGQTPRALIKYDLALPGGLTQVQALAAARVALWVNDAERALRYLKAADDGAEVQENNAEFVGLLADVAWDRSELDLASAALARLVAQGREAPYQAVRWLMRMAKAENPRWLTESALLSQRHPREASVRAQWQAAVFSLGTRAEWTAFWTAQTPAVQAQLGRDAAFLAARAWFWQRLGDGLRAVTDMEAAATLRPRDRGLMSGLLWMLIDGRDRAGLRQWLPRAQALLGGRDAELREAMIAGWLQQREPARALALMQPQLVNRRNDPLWLLGYADALYQSGREAQSQRLRRHAFALLRTRLPAPGTPLVARGGDAANEAARQRLLAWLGLAANEAQPAERRQAWALLLAEARAVRDWHAPQATPLREMLGLWLLASEQPELARAWLWRQHAWQLATPAYQGFAAALQQEDTAELATLLDEVALRAARADRGLRGSRDAATEPQTGGTPVDSGTPSSPSSVRRVGGKVAGPAGETDPKDLLSALRRLDRLQEAAREGNEMAQRLPEGLPEDVALLLQQDLVVRANRVRVTVAERPTQQLDIQAQQAWGRVHLDSGLRLEWSLDARRVRSADPNVLRTEGHTIQRDVSLDLHWANANGHWQLGAGALQGPAAHATIRLRWERQLNPGAVLALEAALAERSQESEALRAAGRQDRLQATLNLRPTQQIDLSTELQWLRLSSAWGRYQGQAVHWRSGAYYYPHRDPMDWRLGLQLQWSRTRADGRPDPRASWLLPSGVAPSPSDFVGRGALGVRLSTGWGLGHESSELYRRDVRSWAEASWARSSTGDSGPALRAGLRGGLLGRDQWHLNWHWDGSGAGRARREWQASYELLFD
ncbi:MAG: tetratricopeptide repeat protein [Hydrogenophaga sp.]|nr:tetratricopeptide repeat protein [Hydrogenophaga sp.]